MADFTFAAHCLCDSPTFEKFLGVDYDTLDATARFRCEFLFNAVCQQIIDYCDNVFKSASYTEVFDGQGSDLLIPRRGPITAISSLKMSQSASSFTNVTAENSDSYNFDDVAVYLKRGATPIGRSSVQLMYTAGYTTIPYDVQLASMIQYSYMEKESGIGGNANTLGLAHVSKMGETMIKEKVEKSHSLCASAVGLLEKYRRVEAPNSVMFARVS